MLLQAIRIYRCSMDIKGWTCKVSFVRNCWKEQGSSCLCLHKTVVWLSPTIIFSHVGKRFKTCHPKENSFRCFEVVAQSIGNVAGPKFDYRSLHMGRLWSTELEYHIYKNASDKFSWFSKVAFDNKYTLKKSILKEQQSKSFGKFSKITLCSDRK